MYRLYDACKRTRSFYSKLVLETGPSDFHLMTLTVVRKGYKKLQSRIVCCRSYEHFSSKNFRENLLRNLSKVNLVSNVGGFKKFCDIGLETLSKDSPYKKKHPRSNQMSFFNKELSKA